MVPTKNINLQIRYHPLHHCYTGHVKICTKCGVDKPLSEYYLSEGKPRSRCKICFSADRSLGVTAWRRRTKIKLIEIHGGKCLDCGGEFPPHVFDFDHRDGSEKAFGISNQGNTKAFQALLVESQKCDLVCANCHRIRTHRRQCSGCEYCE